MKHKFNFIITGILILSGLLALPVLAKAATTTPKANAAGSGQEDMCARVSSGVDDLTDRYQQNMNTYTNRYRSMSDSLTALQTRLQQKGYDTTDLEEDVDTLNGYLENLAQYQNTLMNRFQEMKSHACSEDGIGSQYKNSADAAKVSLGQFRDEAGKMYQLLKGEIKQDLLDIKGQTPTTTED